MDTDLLFHVPFVDSLDATYARGDTRGFVDSRGATPEIVDDGTRAGACFGRDSCIRYPLESNFCRSTGTVMLWFKPDWHATTRLADGLGRILWDLRIEHGSIVPDDPSQRWAIVYPCPISAGARGPDTVQRWRFCVATDRNLHVIGTTEHRSDPRTRQALFGSQQHFAANEWLHIAVAWTKDSAAIILNGQEDARGPLPEGLPTRPLPRFMQIGAVPSWINAGAEGVIADFRIYGVALEPETVARIARAGKR